MSAVTTTAQSGWVTLGGIQEAEQEFATSLMNVKQQLTKAVEIVIAIRNSGEWKESHFTIGENGERVPVFNNFWKEYMPWLLDNYRPQIGEDHGVAWFRARVAWVERALELGYTIDEAMNVPIRIHRGLEQLVDLDNMKFRALKSELSGEDEDGAVKSLVDDVIAGRYNAQELERMTGYMDLSWVKDEQGNVFVILNLEDGSMEYHRLWSDGEVSERLGAALETRLRVKPTNMSLLE